MLIFEFLPQTCEILKEVFNPKQPIVVLVVGGLLGQGKSTWLNTLIYRFIRDENLDYDFYPFGAADATVSITDGLWVYPYPFRLAENPDVQFMLIDMEGMGAIKIEHDKNKVKEIWNKLFTFVQ